MRVAVFVDAGYVYAQGSCVITGLKKPKGRAHLLLDKDGIVKALRDSMTETSPGKELLRVYWYDATSPGGVLAAKMEFGHLHDVKLRLGQLNSEGQQKGVDSLIVTDLIELARNKAIVDAVLLTGDEDVRVGVQIAQSLGVRVHLLGIGGKDSQSQSLSLLQEADTITLWGKKHVAAFLKVTGSGNIAEVQKPVAKKVAKAPVPAKPPAMGKLTAAVKPAVAAVPAKISEDQIAAAIDRAIEIIKKDGQRLTGAKKLAGAGKQLPGPIVAILKVELLAISGSRVTKAEHKFARDAMTKRLKELA